MWIWRRPWKALGNLERAPRNPPAWGTWNGQKGVAGTGEALLGLRGDRGGAHDRLGEAGDEEPEEHADQDEQAPRSEHLAGTA